MDAQWQNGDSSVPGNHIVPQSWNGVFPGGTDNDHKTKQASSVGQDGKQEWISCFDDFYSDVFLHDFENVDMEKYNVVCSLGMRGGLCSLPNNLSNTTSVYSSVTVPSIYSHWNNQTTSTTNFTADNTGCMAAVAEAYLQCLRQTMTREHFQTGTCGYPQGYLQTTAWEHTQGDIQSVGGDHPQGYLQATVGQQGDIQSVGGDHPQGYLQATVGQQGDIQSVGGDHPQGYLQATVGQQGDIQSVGGDHPRGYLQATAGEHTQGDIQSVGGDHPRGYLQATAGQQGDIQSVGGDHPRGYLQATAGEHTQGDIQSVGGEHPRGYLQTTAGEHEWGDIRSAGSENPQGCRQTVGGEHPKGHLQTVSADDQQRHLLSVVGELPHHMHIFGGKHECLQVTTKEHQLGHMQPLDEEHSQVHLQTAQQLPDGAPQQPVEDNCVFTQVRKRNQGTQSLQEEDLAFLPKSLLTSSNCGSTKASLGTSNTDVGLALPSISIIFNNIDEKGESTEACQLHSAESDESIGQVTSSEDRWQTTVSTYGSLSSVKSSPTLGPTSSNHVSSSSDSKHSGKHVRVREVRRAVDEPRRPKNGFIRFSIEHRQQIAVKHPRLDNREISRMLGCKWRKLSSEEKKPYEEEFEKDIQAIREVNPEWRYAPARQLVEELIEPMPSRLRPRNSLKRKKLPSLVRTYSRRQNKSSKSSKKSSTAVCTEMLGAPATPLSQEETSTTWVQCDLCGKWRCLPSFIPSEELCDIWFCYFNPDKRYNSCSIKEELAPEDSAVPSISSCTEYSHSEVHVVSRESTW